MRWLLLCCLLPGWAFAETVVSTRIIRAGAIIQASDLKLAAGQVSGAFEDLMDLEGLEARVMLYPGRPIRYDHVGPPAIVLRNQTVSLVFSEAGLRITAEGRAMSRGGEGDVIRVLNLSSRNTVTGVVQDDGTVRVGTN